MKCEVTGCGNTAEEEMSISLKPKWGKGVYEGRNLQTRVVSVCPSHKELLELGKLKPKQ